MTRAAWWTVLAIALAPGCSSTARPSTAHPSSVASRERPRHERTHTDESLAWSRRVDWDERMRTVNELAVAPDGTVALAGAGTASCFVTSLAPDGSPRWTYWYGERGCRCTGLGFEPDGAVTFGGITHARNTLLTGGASTLAVVEIDVGTGRETPRDSGLEIGAHITQLDPEGGVRWQRSLPVNSLVGPVPFGRSHAAIEPLAGSVIVVDVRSDEVTVHPFLEWHLRSPVATPSGLVMFGYRTRWQSLPDHPLGGADLVVEAGIVELASGSDSLTMRLPLEVDPDVGRLPRVHAVAWRSGLATIVRTTSVRAADEEPVRIHTSDSEAPLVELPSPPNLAWHLAQATVLGDSLWLLATRTGRRFIDEAIVVHRVDLSSGRVDTHEHPIDGEARLDDWALLADGTRFVLLAAGGEITLGSSTVPASTTESVAVIARLPAPDHGAGW